MPHPPEPPAFRPERMSGGCVARFIGPSSITSAYMRLDFSTGLSNYRARDVRKIAWIK